MLPCVTQCNTSLHHVTLAYKRLCSFGAVSVWQYGINANLAFVAHRIHYLCGRCGRSPASRGKDKGAGGDSGSGSGKKRGADDEEEDKPTKGSKASKAGKGDTAGASSRKATSTKAAGGKGGKGGKAAAAAAGADESDDDTDDEGDVVMVTDTTLTKKRSSKKDTKGVKVRPVPDATMRARAARAARHWGEDGSDPHDTYRYERKQLACKQPLHPLDISTWEIPDYPRQPRGVRLTRGVHPAITDAFRDQHRRRIMRQLDMDIPDSPWSSMSSRSVTSSASSQFEQSGAMSSSHNRVGAVGTVAVKPRITEGWVVNKLTVKPELHMKLEEFEIDLAANVEKMVTER